MQKGLELYLYRIKSSLVLYKAKRIKFGNFEYSVVLIKDSLQDPDFNERTYLNRIHVLCKKGNLFVGKLTFKGDNCMLDSKRLPNSIYRKITFSNN